MQSTVLLSLLLAGPAAAVRAHACHLARLAVCAGRVRCPLRGWALGTCQRRTWAQRLTQATAPWFSLTYSRALPSPCPRVRAVTQMPRRSLQTVRSLRTALGSQLEPGVERVNTPKQPARARLLLASQMGPASVKKPRLCAPESAPYASLF